MPATIIAEYAGRYCREQNRKRLYQESDKHDVGLKKETSIASSMDIGREHNTRAISSITARQTYREGLKAIQLKW